MGSIGMLCMLSDAKAPKATGDRAPRDWTRSVRRFVHFGDDLLVLDRLFLTRDGTDPWQALEEACAAAAPMFRRLAGVDADGKDPPRTGPHGWLSANDTRRLTALLPIRIRHEQSPDTIERLSTFQTLLLIASREKFGVLFGVDLAGVMPADGPVRRPGVLYETGASRTESFPTASGSG